MAREIRIPIVPGTTVYVVLYDPSDNAYRGGGVWESPVSGDWAAYAAAIPLTPQVGNLLVGDMPASAVTAGVYLAIPYFQVGASPSAASDLPQTPIGIAWNGPAIAGSIPPAGYPQASDLSNMITSMGILDPAVASAALAAMSLNARANAAQAEWENRTGWVPFLSDGVTVTTRYFDPPGGGREIGQIGGGRFLYLTAGLLSVTTLRSGVGVGSSGQLLTMNSDYFLYPYNASVENKPYRAIEFALPNWGLPRGIAVAGIWGYATAMPGDAWDAVLRAGVLRAIEELQMLISRGVLGLRILPGSEVTYGRSTMPLFEMKNLMKAQFLSTVNIYKRWTG